MVKEYNMPFTMIQSILILFLLLSKRKENSLFVCVVFRVLYYSMHRYDYGEFWPNLRQGDFDYIGEKDGKGFNINVPLNKVEFLVSNQIFRIVFLFFNFYDKQTGFGNSEYSAAFYNLLLPIAYEVT